MPKYRTKEGQCVEAVLWTGDNWPDVFNLIFHASNMTKFACCPNGNVEIWITMGDWTVAPEMVAEKRDCLVKQASGDISVCKPDIFAATYELVLPYETHMPSWQVLSVDPETGQPQTRPFLEGQDESTVRQVSTDSPLPFVLQCPDEECCGCLFQKCAHDAVLVCNECGTKWELRKKE